MMSILVTFPAYLPQSVVIETLLQAAHANGPLTIDFVKDAGNESIYQVSAETAQTFYQVGLAAGALCAAVEKMLGGLKGGIV